MSSTPRKKKKKRVLSESSTTNNAESSTLSGTGRSYTLSVALPGSIISNAQTPELSTCLAGQLARALVVFNVDEVVVFKEDITTEKTRYGRTSNHRNPDQFLERILNYLETPQYLRKLLFPMHSDFRHVGILNPLDCPHHMRRSDHSPYREGVVVVVDQPSGNSGKSLVNCGLTQNVVVDKVLQPGLRVTVAIGDDAISDHTPKPVRGRVVPPSTPRTEAGLYWGYKVRMASSLGAVFTECPYEGGYDLSIGTSERGRCVDDIPRLRSFKHALVVLGGVQGLEHSLRSDHSLKLDDVSLLFDEYLNVCPNQGSRTIRTEEALLVVLSSLRPLLTSANSTHF